MTTSVVLDPEGMKIIDRLRRLGGIRKEGNQSDRVGHRVSSVEDGSYSISAAVGTSRRPIRRKV
jgi:hypothetical protein